MVPEWLDWSQQPNGSGRLRHKVRTMIREHQLAAAVPGPRCRTQRPGRLSSTAKVVKGLPGLLTVLHDAGFDDRESIAWLFLDADLPGRPIDALRENRGAEAKRRAQAMG